MIGRTISHYHITEERGKGGMGVVYKATDTKLDRTVALKFLPTHSLPTDDDVARFQREAKAAASLNHPNIATVYEIDESDAGEAFIAMEFVEGETLADKIRQGPLKLDEAIRIAIQIAEGIAVAHEKGIVHRDLKASNVMLTKKGQVKVMDFGLAKMAEASVLTTAGTTLGTVYYMSPEQARGEEVDHRVDLWALGVMLYEMVSGQLPFPGDYNQAVLYAVMNVDPEALTGLRTGVPMSLEWIVTKLLAKDREHRYQSMTDLLVDLRTIDLTSTGMSRLSTTSRMAVPVSAPMPHVTAVSPAAPATTPQKRFTAITLGIAMLLTAILAAVLVWFVKPVPEVETLTRRFRIQVPGVVVQGSPNLSPDGTQIAFHGVDTSGVDGGIFVYEAQRGTVRYVADSDNVLGGRVFSPEARWMALMSPTGLSVIPAAGGTPVRLSDRVRSKAWLSENELVVSTDSSLYRLYTEGGERVQVAVAKDETEHRAFRELHTLPTGNHVLATALRGASPQVDLVVVDLKSGTYRVLVQQAGAGLYVGSGHIVYLQDNGEGSYITIGQLMARPFDARTQTFTGGAVPLPVGTMTSRQFHISLDGTFISMGATTVSNERDAFWIDTKGTRVNDLLPPHGMNGWRPRALDDPVLSPDGRFLAYEIQNTAEGQQDIWIYDVKNRTENRLSFAGYSSDPAWSPDGRYVIYDGEREGHRSRALLRKPVDGSSTEEIIPIAGDNLQSPALSQDGRWLVYRALYDGAEDITVAAADDLSNVWRAERKGNQRTPSFSPDGRFVLFMTRENDLPEVYVQRVGGNAFWAVSAADEQAFDPVWSWDGRYIYYIVAGVGLRRVRVEMEPSFRRFAPETVFRSGVGGLEFALHPDGERILVVSNFVTEADRNYFDLVLGFGEELKRLAPPGE